ncbi:MAG: hypothetical protein U5N56_11350 [Candidatus Marinimicrobia bacterium]|nr:hypothetical protein [Candidatus Neomarinimicrobiota bacterium]
MYRRYILLLVLILTACGRSHHNELVYRFNPGNNAIRLDSLKILILSENGIEMFASYPDSNVCFIQYDRYKTHQRSIEEHFLTNGYTLELLQKNSVEEKEKPWEKKQKQ